jgi:hypothetical protein
LFFTDSGWWKAAENLKVGDKILNSKGELKTLIGKDVEALQEPEKIYNLNVDEFHTYFVGESGLLVHNDCSEAMTALKRLILQAIESAKDIAQKWNSKFLNKALPLEERFRCMECAEEIKNMLIGKGLKGQQVKVQYSAQHWIWSDFARDSISQNGFHTGILFEGKIYDNIHTNGISLEDWLNDLDSLGERTVTYIDF